MENLSIELMISQKRTPETINLLVRQNGIDFVHDNIKNLYFGKYKDKYDEFFLAYCEYFIKLASFNAEKHHCVWHIIGLFYYSNKEYRKAIEFMEKALSCDGNNCRYLFNLGLVYNAFKKFQLSCDCYSKLIDLKYENSDVYNMLAFSYKNVGRQKNCKGKNDIEYYRLSEKYYLKSIEYDSNNYFTLTNISDVYRYMGDRDNAVSFMLKAIKIKDNWSEFQFKLGRVYFDFSEYKNAQVALEKAIKMNPKYHQAMVMLGETYEFMGNISEKINYYKKAALLNNSKAKNWLEKNGHL